MFDSPFGPTAQSRTTQRYEWLPGRQFLIHRLDGRLGEHQIACVEIIGYEDSTGHFPVHAYYNNGLEHNWEASMDVDTWTVSGAWEIDGRRHEICCVIGFTDDGNAIDSTWKYRQDATVWAPFWHSRLIRV